jgi:hypothetical protein
MEIKVKPLNYLLRSEITDTDVLENISDDTTAIFIDEDNCWIEVLNNNDNYFFVPDGWEGTVTNNIDVAKTALIKFKIDNQIPIL